MVNAALESAGQQIRVDHRSYREQGIAKQPTRHRGTGQQRMKTDMEPVKFRVRQNHEVRTYTLPGNVCG
jgi:hypothetical protein